ncbi:MAG: hypothetical protein P1V51_13425, partial [Deltaproteobacteria bacterium]|nr:hypothetical protein [Deltaproteobacteria bacterium]
MRSHAPSRSLAFAGLLALAALVAPRTAHAWPAKYATCSQGGCHVNVDADAVITTAVDGAAGTSGSTTPGGTFEIDYRFTNIAGNGVVGVLAALPSGWTIGVGTANSPAIAGWNSVWDVSGGETWDATLIATSNVYANAPDGYTLSFDNTSWDAGNRNSAWDDGSAGDLDGTANNMGMDFTVSVPGGATPGSYEVWVLGVGHEGNKAHKAQMISVTVGAGGDSVTLGAGTDPAAAPSV